ncbi:MAG: hypothetical protein J7K98_01715 [Candidatus Aenigmarchaeota archaeon]|nr:hypothetical protein [Candidatus Aenigmarchaeota archaeon]
MMSRGSLELDKKDIAILRVLDGLRGSFEFVLISKISEKTPFSQDFIFKRLEKMNKLKLVELRKYEVEWGCRITQKGMDTLAVWNFKTHDVIKTLLTEIGVGKESVIYSAITPDNNFAVLKFHRYYAVEFERIKNSLAYVAIKWRGEELKIEDYMIDVPRAKAQVEFKVMKILHEKGFSVPKPLDLDRHVIAMEMVCDEPGVPSRLLKDLRLTNPKEAKEAILEEYMEIVEKAGVIHGDLSEYNIMIKKTGEFFIIDWPQAVPKDFENADKLLERDLENINNYFWKYYRV